MGLGRFPPGLDEQIAAQAARMGNRSAHRFILSEIYRQKPAGDRVSWHKQRLWQLRAKILAANPELAQAARELTRRERLALRVAASEVFAPPTPSRDVPVPAFPAAHPVPPAVMRQLQQIEIEPESFRKVEPDMAWSFDDMAAT